ncbi:MAG: glycosyltransferase family 2 protein [Armatimonadetes bacterium]|nr:glycosyltransferase family 2 protein [Armatimonadota bacterium]
MSGESAAPFLSVVIPAYNEENRLGPTLETIKVYLAERDYTSEVLVVDNGSRDRTSEVAREAGVEVMEERRRGKGAAVRTGMLAARGEYVLFSDADLSTPIEEVEKLLAGLRAGADVAIASRGLPESNLVKRQPWYRELVGRGGNLLVRMMAVRGIADTQCGFKLFPREIARRIFPAQRLTGAAFDVELLFIVQHAGWKIAEVPVTWIDSPDTRFSRVRDSLDAVKDLFRIRINWLLGRYRL